MWCFQCGAEYGEDVGECIECGVATVGHAPTPAHLVGDQDDPQIAYDLHGWDYDARLALELALRDARVPHGWDGPSLVIRELDEDVVDDLIDGCDPDADVGLDPETDEALVAFDLAAHNDVLRERLGAALTSEGIAHRIAPDGFLLVSRADEDEVADLLDGIQTRGEPDPGFGPGVEGVHPSDVFSELFVNADRLRRNQRDSGAILDFLEAEELATRLSLPFGMEPRYWRSVLDGAARLRSALGDGDEDVVAEAAEELRDLLRPYV